MMLQRYEQSYITSMPTIEIISINSVRLNLNQADFDIAIIEENILESHRGLFYDYLRMQNGVIVHLGNPYFKEYPDSGFFAGQLIDWSFDPDYNLNKNDDVVNEQEKFRFLDEYKLEIQKLLEAAIDNSPINKAYFLTDYQFGQKSESILKISTSMEFWSLHDNQGLTFNKLYKICADQKGCT